MHVSVLVDTYVFVSVGWCKNVHYVILVGQKVTHNQIHDCAVGARLASLASAARQRRAIASLASPTRASGAVVVLAVSHEEKNRQGRRRNRWSVWTYSPKQQHYDKNSEIIQMKYMCLS